MSRILSLPILLWIAVSLLAAADVTGNWLGTIDVKDEGSGTTITTPVRLQLDQQNTTVSGKIGRTEDAEVVPIKNVKVDGNKISFEASNGETSAPCKFVLTINGDNMEGDMKTSVDADELTGKVKIARAKK